MDRLLMQAIMIDWGGVSTDKCKARFPIFVDGQGVRYPRTKRRGSQKHALWLGSRRGNIPISPATQPCTFNTLPCQPKWELAPTEMELSLAPLPRPVMPRHNLSLNLLSLSARTFLATRQKIIRSGGDWGDDRIGKSRFVKLRKSRPVT
jgi:hypothetical protein